MIGIFRKPEMACNFPSPLHSLYESKYLALTYSELLLVCDSVTINITNDMAKAVREETVKQTESKLWFKFRAGRITASRMKQACHTDPAMPSQSLVKAICYPEAYKICTQATQWGCQHETFALEQYTSSQSSKHQVFSVKNCGLFLNPKWPHLGASPDSIVACDCCGKGAVEIKCPLCNKDEDIEATVLNSKSCLIVVDGSIHLDKKHAYYYQVQTQIFVAKYHTAIFVSAHFLKVVLACILKGFTLILNFGMSVSAKQNISLRSAFYQNLLESGTQDQSKMPLQEPAHLQLVPQLQSAKLQNPQNIFTATVDSQNPQMAPPRQK